MENCTRVFGGDWVYKRLLQSWSEMLSPIAVGVIIYASNLVILCVGFSLTHMME